ncbi:hypothetical protein [Algoriphagus namhaensis]
MEEEEIRKLYKKVEVRLLILLGISLPIFGVVYLYYNSGNLSWQLPQVSPYVETVMVGLGLFFLLAQYFLFRKRLLATFQEEDLLRKVQIYAGANLQRIHLLAISCVLDALGLLLFKNPIFVVLFAITLVFFSLAKPSPDRMIRLMKLSKKQGDIIRTASRPVS